MYTRKTEEDLDCGIRVAFLVFGGKWKLCIIDAINNGVIRPAEISKTVPGATPRVIEMQLAELLRDGVVDRCPCEGYPRRSEYALTPFGQTIVPVLRQIDKWGKESSAHVRNTRNNGISSQSPREEKHCDQRKIAFRASGISEVKW